MQHSSLFGVASKRRLKRKFSGNSQITLRPTWLELIRRGESDEVDQAGVSSESNGGSNELDQTSRLRIGKKIENLTNFTQSIWSGSLCFIIIETQSKHNRSEWHLYNPPNDPNTQAFECRREQRESHPTHRVLKCAGSRCPTHTCTGDTLSYWLKLSSSGLNVVGLRIAGEHTPLASVDEELRIHTVVFAGKRWLF